MKVACYTALLRIKLRSRLWLKRVGLNLLGMIAALTGVAGLSLLTAVTVVACGGASSNVAGVGSGGTGTFSAYTVGSITGFGSIFVNGQHFDDSGATVSDDDGLRSRDDLRLGMVVKVQGSVDTTGTGTASTIAFDSELQGPVASVDAAGQAFSVIGQKVLVDASTVFDSSLPNGLRSVIAGQELEVHGFLNAAANLLQASRVELKSETKLYKISGLVTNLQSASQTLQIGAQTINVSGLGSAGIASLFNGAMVKLRLEAKPPGNNGVWTALRARSSQDTPSDKEQAQLEGLVTAVASTTLFSVSGVPVDASKANFTDGSAGLQVGARVEVKGKLIHGTLVASEVELQRNKGKSIELTGDISSLDTTSKTFVLRGTTVSYSAALPFDNGNESQLSGPAPVTVEVKGQLDPSSTFVIANRLKFKN
jgi:Domain of unknown function (DUF5666)